MPPEEVNSVHHQDEGLEYTYYICPYDGCNQIATLEWTDTMNSTDGPIEIGKIRCALNHWFMQPTEGLELA